MRSAQWTVFFNRVNCHLNHLRETPRFFARNLALILGFFALIFAATSVQAQSVSTKETIRVSAASFPQMRGNPFSFVLVPGIWIYGAIFDSITRISADGTLQPALATSWRRLSPTLWRFELRPNVTFSNGEVFDSAAVIAAFDYLATPDGKTTRAAIQVASVKSVRADGPNAVLIETKVHEPILPQRMAAIRVPAPKYLAEVGMAAFSGAPVGTGPFKVDAWGSARISLSAFQQSWRAPVSKALEFRLIPEATARQQALMSGAVDIAFALDPESGEILNAGGAKLIAEKSASNLVIALRTDIDGPLRDVRVRQAMNYAVNKSLMVETLMSGESVVASQVVPPGIPGFDPSIQPYPHQPETARKLLAEAGFPNGFDLTIEAPVAGGSNSGAVYTMVASDLTDVGIRTRIDAVPNSETLRHIMQGGWNGSAFVMTTDAMPAMDPMTPFSYFSCRWPSKWYCNPDVTPLIEAAEQELDDTKRKTLVNNLLRRYHDEAAMIYLFQLANFTGVSSRVQNFRSDFGIITYDQIYKQP